MMRAIGKGMIQLILSDPSPTRAVEFMLGWLMLVWGAAFLLPYDMMAASQYKYVVALMTQSSWATLAISIGAMRLIALVINGAWRRTPILRFFATLVGLNWWLVIFILLVVAVKGGSQPFPAMFFYPVFIFFEMYSSFRCGQDARSMNALGAG